MSWFAFIYFSLLLSSTIEFFFFDNYVKQNAHENRNKLNIFQQSLWLVIWHTKNKWLRLFHSLWNTDKNWFFSQWFFFPLLFVWSFSDWTDIYVIYNWLNTKKMQGIAKFRANRLFCGREMMDSIFHYRFSLLWFVSWVTEWWNLTGIMKQKTRQKQERNTKSMFIAHQYLTLVVSFSFHHTANTSSVNSTSQTKKKK